ncbi:MAG: type I-B CRISPR-associated protein Cas5 [Clostridiaceae bacterium]|nr:type I-B CRISPR-associated protein Cas5 [Clostridiaceae bacterium]
MDVVKFTLKGETAFFKKPDVNTYLYFTYGTIHKVALLGMFGAILGYSGYNQMSFLNDYKKEFGKALQKDDKYKDRSYPEFYSRLKDLKIAIVRKSTNISKKVQTFNNSVGYASKEAGGNLIIKEQWLENPDWDIYFVIDSEESRTLAKALKESRFVYVPYLGKNDHLADICDVQVIEGITEVIEPDNVDSLFIKQDFEFDEVDDLEDLFEEKILTYKYEEKLPVALEETNNKYEFETFISTNLKVKSKGEVKVFNEGKRSIVFF